MPRSGLQSLRRGEAGHSTAPRTTHRRETSWGAGA